MGDLTKNFSWSEFDSKDGSKMPDEVKGNIRELAENLQVLREALALPIKINSGYRSPSHNKKVGGSPNSQHLQGKAADIVVKGIHPSKVAVLIEDLIKNGKMKQGGIGIYNTFVHYDIRGNKARW